MMKTSATFLLCLFLVLIFGFSSFVFTADAQEKNRDADITSANAPPSPFTSPYKGAGPNEKRKIDISLDNMDIYPVLEQVLGNTLGLNFVVEPSIKGTISMHISGDYTKSQLLDIVNSVLQMQGLAVTAGGHGLYKVVRKANSPKMGVVISTNNAKRSGDVIKVIQLEYLSAAQAVSNLRNLVSPGAVIIPVASSNSLILSDTVDNVSKVVKILKILDESIFKDVHWRLFILENTDVEDLAKDLENIFKANVLYKRPGIDANGLQIITLKTLNGILVVTRWEKVLGQVANWIHELDQGQLDQGSRVYVYFVQNGKAKDLADILNELYGESGSSKTKKQILVKREQKVKGELNIATKGELTGEVKIIADEINNSLIFKARPKDYAIIRDLLKKLDILPRQVLIEVLVAEVTLNNEVKYGVEWYIENKGININGKPYSANMMLDAGQALAQDVGLGNSLPGFTYSLYDGDGTLKALINLLDTSTDVDILSTPNILAADNQEARIEIGEDVPVLSESTISSGGVKTQGVQYRKTGIILQVKPSINDNGLVRLEITQEVSKVNDQQTAGITSPRITNRKATTYVIAKDGQHILMGGLMSTMVTEVTHGIPLLKDIPILGYLFGSKGTKTEKKELIFILTPHVVKSRGEADRLTKEFALKVHSLRTMLEESHILEKEKEKALEEQAAKQARHEDLEPKNNENTPAIESQDDEDDDI
ncbi:MAG: type II secretion system protein GspD [Thermodesulfatator sp.]|nr:MAG: type II secretion system protein GspD [Thermodesulfatator sp.]